MEVTVKKLGKAAIVYKIAPSENSELAGRKIVGVASVGNKNAFAWICTLSEYYPSSSSIKFLHHELVLIYCSTLIYLDQLRHYIYLLSV